MAHRIQKHKHHLANRDVKYCVSMLLAMFNCYSLFFENKHAFLMHFFIGLPTGKHIHTSQSVDLQTLPTTTYSNINYARFINNFVGPPRETSTICWPHGHAKPVLLRRQTWVGATEPSREGLDQHCLLSQRSEPICGLEPSKMRKV